MNGYNSIGTPNRILEKDFPLKRKTAIVIGNFDGVHLGHQELIRRIDRFCRKNDSMPVVLTFSKNQKVDSFGIRLINGDAEMLESFFNNGIKNIYEMDFEAIRNMGCEEFVDIIVEQKLNAEYVVVGEDFTFGKNRAGSSHTLNHILENRGIQCEIVPLKEIDGIKISSSEIRSFLLNGNVEKANEFLGREFSYILPVAYGKQLGGKIGFPTINQQIPRDRVVPKYGVYSSKVELGDKQFYGITNIGMKPTVGSDYPSAETYIFDFTGDLYGKTVKVSLIKYIRPERKFQTVEELKYQIQKDVKFVRENL